MTNKVVAFASVSDWQSGLCQKTRLSIAGQALLCLVLLLTVRVFQYFPGFSPLQETAFGLAPLSLLAALMLFRGQVLRISQLELYLLLLMAIIPIGSAIAASDASGQPFWYGLLAMRSYGLISVSLVLLFFLRARLITLGDIERAFLTCAWLTLVIYVTMTLTLDAADFAEYGIGFTEDRLDEGVKFKLNGAFILFAAFHYGVRAFRGRKPALYLLAGIHFGFLFGGSGARILTVSVVLSMLAVSLLWGGIRRFVTGILWITAIGFVMAQLASSDVLADRISKFAEAFEALGGEDPELINDPSAASRVRQSEIVKSFIESRLLTGHGRISAQWIDNSFSGYFGEHFFPDDIGILGSLYQFGLLGTVALALQFVFAWIFKRRIPSHSPATIEDTSTIYLIYLAISSIATGAFALYPEFSVLFVVLLAYMTERHELDSCDAPVFAEKMALRQRL